MKPKWDGAALVFLDALRLALRFAGSVVSRELPPRRVKQHGEQNQRGENIQNPKTRGASLESRASGCHVFHLTTSWKV